MRERAGNFLLDTAILAIYPFIRLYYRIGEKVKEKEWT